MGKHSAPSNNGVRVGVVGALASGIFALNTSPSMAASPDETLAAIAQCESGGNHKAQNPSSTASGTYQFLDGTWRAMGGSGRAKDASPAEQHQRARALLAQQGTSPWNASKSCWSSKVGKVPAAAPAPQARKETPKSLKRAPQARTDTPKRVHKAPQARAQAPVRKSGSYTVKRGDTLAKVAAAHGTTWRALHKANPQIKNPNVIYIGQTLKVG